jgi:hypothetical protein
MKKILFILISIISLTTLMCDKKQVKNNTVIPANKSDPIVEERFYEQEGFISKDLYRVIIVRPYDSTTTDPEIEKLVKNKALTSLKKYLSSLGKPVTKNTDSEILNLISDYGKIIPHDDKKHSRTIFALDIMKSGCKAYVEGLSK